MSLIAISGPTDPTNSAAIQADFKRHVTQADTIYSGGAHGVDTIGAVVAKAQGAKLVLVVPMGKWYNEVLHEFADEIVEVEGGYMARNDKLAELADSLVAYPPSSVEELRSGTWATVRRFRKRGKDVTIRAVTGG